MTDDVCASSSDSCREVARAVHDYLDGQVDPRIEAVIADHLQQCPPCRHLVGFEQAVRTRMRRCCGTAEAPADLRVRILTRISEVRVDENRVSGVRVNEVRVSEVRVTYREGHLEPPGSGER